MTLMRERYLKVFVVILNYNSWQDTIDCIESVMKSDYPDFQVIVLDNNSSDNSMKYLKEWAEKKGDYIFFNKDDIENLPLKKSNEIFGFKDVKHVNKYFLVLIQNGENRGYAAGNNVFLRFLLNQKGDFFVFLLNPDTLIKPDTIKEFVNCALKEKGVFGAVMFDYYFPSKELFKAGFMLTFYGTVKPIKNKSEIEKLDFISGSAMFCHIDVLKEVGLLPEEYFLYWEDTDWCTRAKRLGIKLLLCENARVFDKGGKSVGGRKNNLSEYYYTLNIFRFFNKYFPSRKKTIYFFVFLRGLKKILMGDFSKGITILKALNKVLFKKEI